MTDQSAPALKKVLGFPSLFAAGIGLVVAQSCFVSILQGVGNGGASFLIALVIAFILTLCYGATFAELSLMMPKAGGLSTYTLTAMGPFPAIVATICGYIIPNILVSPAELFLLEEIFSNLFPGAISYIGLLVIIFFAVLNLLWHRYFFNRTEYTGLYHGGSPGGSRNSRVDYHTINRYNDVVLFGSAGTYRWDCIFPGFTGALGFPGT